MNKIITALICIVVIIGAIFTAIFINENKDRAAREEETRVEKVADEDEILEESIDHYEEIDVDDALVTNAEQEKISPNCALKTETLYKQCGHIKSEYQNMPEDLVNKTQSDIEERFKEFTVKSFAPNEVVLYKEVNLNCNEHYIVREHEGTIMIYRVNEDGQEEEFEETEIAIDYLTEDDKMNIQKGIEVNGTQNLNHLLEDFE